MSFIPSAKINYNGTILFQKCYDYFNIITLDGKIITKSLEQREAYKKLSDKFKGCITDILQPRISGAEQGPKKWWGRHV